MRFIIVIFLGPLLVLVTEPSKLRCRLTGGKFHNVYVPVAGLAAASPVAYPGGSDESIAVSSQNSWLGELALVPAI